jgi:hypothetical protein
MLKLAWNYLKWIWNGNPTIKYPGYHCGCCGEYWDIPFEIATYKSAGKWWDTWGLCPKGKGCNKY